MSLSLRIRLLAAVLLLTATNALSAQQQDWLWNYPRAQPFFDLPWQRRLDTCAAHPAEWQCEPEGNGEAAGGCGDGGCSECEDACGCPHWMARRKCGFYLTADFAPMFYDSNTSANFARLGPLGPFVLHTGDLPTEFNAGGRFLMGAQLTCRIAVEGSYQGFYNYAADAAERDASTNLAGGIGNLQSPFSNFGVPALPGVDNNNLIAISLRNRFNTADLNFRYQIEMPPGPFDVSFLVGARFARIDELFRYQSQTTTPTVAAVTNDIAINTGNELWGPQLGFSTNTLITERFWVEFTGKAAMLNNSAHQQTTTLITTNGQTATINGAAGASRTAFLLDGVLLANYQLTHGLSFHAGYQAVWIDGVALGVANFETNLAQLLAGPAQLDHSATAIYHGPLLGITWAR